MRLNSCEAAKLFVAQNKVQAISLNCSNSVEIHYNSSIKWLCDSSIASKQMEKKVASSEL